MPADPVLTDERIELFKIDGGGGSDGKEGKKEGW
jgi:hypothetical protein